MSRFKHYPVRPKKLTAAFAKAEYQKLLDRLPAAEKYKTQKLWLELFADWNALESYIGSEVSRIYYAYSMDLSNEKLESAFRYIRQKISPAIDEQEHQLLKAFVASRHRDAVAEKYGSQLIPLAKIALRPSDPVNTKLRIKASDLSQEYEKMAAEARVIVEGKKMNLTLARSFQESREKKLRRESFVARTDWVLANRRRLSNIYNELVKLRTQMAKNVGHPNYVALAYENMGRTDYKVEDVALFRATVKQYAVPLYERVCKEQAKALGQKTLKPWDMFYHPRLTLPSGIVPVDKQAENAAALFSKLSPRLGRHFKRMLDEELIDLPNRPSKRSPAFCITFSDEQKVAVICNSIGDSEDIRTLTHEMGHAFQGWESQHIESVDLQHPTVELCEVHSMGMEFLSLPYIGEFLDAENSRKYSIGRWREAIYLLCYASAVDEFQHRVYEKPGLSPAVRDELWSNIIESYLPAVDYKGIENRQKTRWYLQAHIFSAPFYYIDYALAETVAMQLALVAEKDHDKALSSYLDLCQMGGTMSFLKTLKHAGLRSPFDKKLMSELTVQAEKVLL